MNNKVIHMIDIVKSYNMGEEDHEVLHGIDLSIDKGEFVSVHGPSGSGKSTLMNIMGCLDNPTSGDYMMCERSVAGLSEKQLARIRGKEIGFIFQSFQLLSRFDAMRNVELSMIYSGYSPKVRHKTAAEMLERVGLKDKLHHYPNQLSGGQQQRVCIARALATDPTLLLADEPTGALDQKTGHTIIDLFQELHSEGKTIVMITHDKEIAKRASRVVSILDGNLYEGETAKAGEENV